MYSVFFKFPVESSTYIYILKKLFSHGNNYFTFSFFYKDRRETLTTKVAINTLKLCHLTLEILKQLQLDGCKGNDA